MNKRNIVLIAFCLLAAGTGAWLWRSYYPAGPASAASPERQGITHSIHGTWATSREIARFSGTILSIEGTSFTEWFYSDAGPVNDGNPIRGAYSFSGTILTVPASPPAGGATGSGSAGVWHLDRINGVSVLLRGDALKAWRTTGRLYDYGILIKIDDAATTTGKVKRPSIKQLYSDPAGGWRDPDVYGPNSPN
jgi:hypothetical protein